MGKQLLGGANIATGGLAGTVADNLINKARSNAGLIGKFASGIGKHYLSQNSSNRSSSLTDQAIKYIPKGNARDALSKINDAAQGRTKESENSTQIKTPKKRIKKSKKKAL